MSRSPTRATRGSKEDDLGHEDVVLRLQAAQKDLQSSVSAVREWVDTTVVAATLGGDGSKAGFTVAKAVKLEDALGAVDRVCMAAMRVTSELSEAEEAAAHKRLKEKIKSQDVLYKVKMEQVRSASRMQLAQQEAQLSAQMRREMDDKLRKALESAGRGDMSDLITSKEALEVEVRSLKDRVRQLDSALESSRAEAADAQSKLPILRAQVQRLDENLADTQAKLSSSEEALHATREALREKGIAYDELRAELYAAQAAISDAKTLRMELDAVSKDKAQLQTQLAWALEAKQLADAALEMANANGADEAARLREQEEQARAAQEESAELAARLEEAEGELGRTKEEYASFKAQMGDVAGHLEELGGLRKRTEELELEVAMLNEVVAAKQAALEASEGREQAKADEAKALSSALEALKKESETAIKDAQWLRDAYDKAKAKAEKFQSRLSELEKDLNDKATIAGGFGADADPAVRLLLKDRERAQRQCKEALERLEYFEMEALSLEQMIELVLTKHAEELKAERARYDELYRRSRLAFERFDTANEVAAKCDHAMRQAIRAMDQSTQALQQVTPTLQASTADPRLAPCRLAGRFLPASRPPHAALLFASWLRRGPLK